MVQLNTIRSTLRTRYLIQTKLRRKESVAQNEMGIFRVVAIQWPRNTQKWKATIKVPLQNPWAFFGGAHRELHGSYSGGGRTPQSLFRKRHATPHRQFTSINSETKRFTGPYRRRLNLDPETINKLLWCILRAFLSPCHIDCFWELFCSPSFVQSPERKIQWIRK